MSATDLLKTLGVTSHSSTQQPSFKLATIPSNYTSGNPTLIFDGEGSASTRTYPCISSYVPVANDRVVVAMIGHGGLVIGKIGGSTLPLTWQSPTFQNGYSTGGAPYSPCFYTKTSDGVVHLKGIFSVPSSGAVAYQTVFQFPQGYRPATDLLIATSANDAYFGILIDTSGNLQCRSTPPASSWVSLDTTSFIAEQ